MCARAACAPTPRRRALSDSAFLGFGLAAFLTTLGAQYGLYHRLLREPLRTRDVEQFRPALNRWLKVTVVWQVLVVSGSVLYLAALTSRHGHSLAWVAPPVGAVFGSAFPLQLVAMTIARSFRT